MLKRMSSYGVLSLKSITMEHHLSAMEEEVYNMMELNHLFLKAVCIVDKSLLQDCKIITDTVNVN